MAISDSELEELYDRYADVLFHRCRGILGNDEEARDAVQETFARVIVHEDAFRRDSSPLTWMYRIATNHCLNRIRNQGRRRDKRRHHGAEMPAPRDETVDRDRWEAERTVRRLLEDADDETRAIVIHLFFDDMTRADTAKMVGISQPTLRKRLRRFLAQARTHLEPTAEALTPSGLGMLLFFGVPPLTRLLDTLLSLGSLS